MAKLSRRNHYLPQFYLKGFADEGGAFWLFDRERKEYRLQKPINTGVEKDFYQVTRPDGEKTDEVEKMLSAVEGTCKQIIDRVDNRVVRWDGEDRPTFALFAALMRTRVPVFDQEQNDFLEKFYRWWAKAKNPTVESVREGFLEFEAATGEGMLGVSPEDVFQMIRDDSYALEKPRQNNIKMMLNLALQIAPVLLGMDWMILYAPKGSAFVTCDNPFAVAPPTDHDDTYTGYGISTPGATTMLPLSSKTAIVFKGTDGRVAGGECGRDFVEHVNWFVTANSDKFAIARDKALLERMVRSTAADEFQPKRGIRFNAPDPYAPSI
jgi:hypothetical protein